MAGNAFTDMMIRTLQAADGGPDARQWGTVGRYNAPMGSFGRSMRAPRMMGFQQRSQGVQMPTQMQPDVPWSLSPAPRPAGLMPVASQPTPAVHSQPMTPAIGSPSVTHNPDMSQPGSTAAGPSPEPSPAQSDGSTSIMGFNPLAAAGSPQTAADQIAGGDMTKLAARTYRNGDGSMWNDYYRRGGQG